MPAIPSGITTLDLQYVNPGIDGVLKMERGVNPAPVQGAFPVVGMVIMWAGTSATVPRGWRILREFDDVYLKGATTDEEVLTTGGTLDHLHTSPQHDHTSAQHNHTDTGHNHTDTGHSHTGGTHTHEITAHSHAVNDHKHTLPDHSHDIDDHGHTIPVHAHTYGGTTGQNNAHETDNIYSAGDTNRDYTNEHAHEFSGTTADYPAPAGTFQTNNKTGLATDDKTSYSTNDNTTATTKDNPSGTNSGNNTTFSTASNAAAIQNNAANIQNTTPANVGMRAATVDTTTINPSYLKLYLIRYTGEE